MSLQVHLLACSRGDRELFNNINFQVNAGEALRVAGTNGSGKTSLLRMLCGLAYPTKGVVRWNGRNVREVREEFNSQLIYLGHANGVKDDLVAWENVVVSSTLSGKSVGRDEACSALEKLGLGRAVNLPTQALSQGQRKRVALARLQLGQEMPLWILDEPFTALDKNAVAELCMTLNTHLERGGMIIYTTHQEIVLNAQRSLHLDLKEGGVC